MDLSLSLSGIQVKFLFCSRVRVCRRHYTVLFADKSRHFYHPGSDLSRIHSSAEVGTITSCTSQHCHLQQLHNCKPTIRKNILSAITTTPPSSWSKEKLSPDEWQLNQHLHLPRLPWSRYSTSRHFLSNSTRCSSMHVILSSQIRFSGRPMEVSSSFTTRMLWWMISRRCSSNRQSFDLS